MSHFTTVVLLKGDPNEHEIAELMEPYSEHLESEPRQQTCWCVGREAKKEAEMLANAECGTLNHLRETFDSGELAMAAAEAGSVAYRIGQQKGHDSKEFEEADARRAKLDDEAGVAWRKHISEHQKREEELFAAHPLKHKANDSCESCDGTGVETVTHNPDGQWDWYVVGGRWDGWITDTKVESKDNGFNFGDEHHQLGKNSIKVEKLLDQEELKAPFALITPDGVWHQRGNMGWFGMASDEKDKGSWEDEVRDLYEQHKDCIAVCLDCHT